MVKFFRTFKLRKKLLISFFGVTCLSIMITTIFSIFYFTRKIKEEATDNMRKYKNVAEMIYQSNVHSIESFTKQLAGDSKVKTFVSADFRTEKKLNDYIKEIVIREKIYHISVLNEYGKTVSKLGLSNQAIYKSKLAIDINKSPLINRGLSGDSITGIELIPTVDGVNILSITSISPIIKEEQLKNELHTKSTPTTIKKNLGILIVRYILNDNKSFGKEIKSVLDVDMAIYHKEKPITSTNPYEEELGSRIYNFLIKGDDHYYENINFSFGGRLEEYITLFDVDNKPVAVLGINLSAGKYLVTLRDAIMTFLIIMVLCIVGASFLSYFVSLSITGPIHQLLTGVGKITAGDLSYEIMIDLKDEIGSLSESFNAMRLSLNDKISTIEKMNQNLENTVNERTKTIESLLNKMKKYLSPQLYDSIIGGKRGGKLVHDRKKLTIFFSDIVGFTETTDAMQAEDLSELLNYYLDNMAKIALKWGGTIDKFVGDAVMVFFGDPEFVNDRDHALRATRMALEMIEKMKELRTEWRAKGVENPLHIRIGINSGYCTVGNFGSENRMDYTIIGKNVNLASRLESSAKKDTIHISHETYSLIKDEISCEFEGEIHLKGINHPVKSYNVIRDKGSKKKIDFIKVNEEGIFLQNIDLTDPGLSDYDKDKMLHALKLAIAFTQGKVKHVFNKEKNKWELVHNRE